ncbi:unnamed protein product [Caenorhabditis brenneri]
MRFKSICLLTISIVKTVSSSEPISIFQAVPFIAYFDIVQCSLLFILTLVILILTAVYFHQTRPYKLTLSRPSVFEYYVLKGEKSGAQLTSTSRSAMESSGASMETSRTGTYGTAGNSTTETGTETGTKTEEGISYFAM